MLDALLGLLLSIGLIGAIALLAQLQLLCDRWLGMDWKRWPNGRGDE